MNEEDRTEDRRIVESDRDTLLTEIGGKQIETVPESGGFSPMLQGTGTNQFTQISTRRKFPNIDEITGLATLTSGTLTVFIEKYNSLTGGLRIFTHKLLDACTIALTAQNHYKGTGPMNTLVVIPLEDYMAKCGIPLTKASKDKTRRKVKEDLEALYNTSIEWTEPWSGQTRDFAKMRICDMVAIKNSNIHINFSQVIAHYLTHAYIMQYPLGLLRLDERNPSSYHLGKKILLHHSIANNRKKGAENVLSVRSLLENAPEIPSYEEIKAGDRMYSRRIIRAFEDSLDMLDGILRWEYCNAKGEPLTEDQLKKFNYPVFIECYVHFEVGRFPHKKRKSKGKE